MKDLVDLMMQNRQNRYIPASAFAPSMDAEETVIHEWYGMHVECPTVDEMPNLEEC